ncbi:MAG TPA: hypothetical protein VFR97_03145, partial [Capillimicrobium sp.]|nr:hypothetical protein [Capillimicrobium sp.]
MQRKGLLGVLSAVALCAMVPASAQGAGSAACEATAFRGTVLGQGPFAPVTAGGASACEEASAGGVSALPVPLSASAAFARTGRAGGAAARATAGMADLRLRTLEDLRVPLPIDQVANRLAAIPVPLTSSIVETLDPGGTLTGDGGLLGGDGPLVIGGDGGLLGGDGGLIIGGDGGLLGGDGGLLGGDGGLLGGSGDGGGTGGGSGDSGGGLLGNLPLGDLPLVEDVPIIGSGGGGGLLGGSGGTTSGGTTSGGGTSSGGGGLLGGLFGKRRAATRQAPVAGVLVVDLRPAIAATLPDGRLPATDLVAADALAATATATCAQGRQALEGSTDVTGLRVLGDAVAGDAPVERSLRLTSPTIVDPSKLDLRLIRLPAGLSFSDPVSGPLLQSAVRTVLAGLPRYEVPATVANVTVTPGAQTRTAGALTQQALRVQATVAGQSVADVVIGEASVSAADGACAAGGGGSRGGAAGGGQPAGGGSAGGGSVREQSISL